MIVTDERVALFVSEHLGSTIIPPYTSIGVERGGEIVTGVVFNHFEAADIHMTVAGNCWTKGLLADIGEYVFGQLKCLRITAVTEQPHVVRLAERCGGQVEGLMRNHFGEGRDGYLVGFLKQDWKF
jgi:hypothetical protein